MIVAHESILQARTGVNRGIHTRWLAYGLLIAGILTWRAAVLSRERRNLLRRRELHPLHDLWVHVNGHRLYARISKLDSRRMSAPVVLVHGWGVSGSYFIPLAERLAGSFDVYLPDLPGHGMSETPPKPLDVDDLAAELIDWMDAIGIARASLVGHSMGCQVAVQIAIRQPPRVDRLILIGITPDPGARGTLQQVRRFVIGGAYERFSLNYHLVKDYVRMGARLIPGWGHAVQYSGPALVSERIQEFLRAAV